MQVKTVASIISRARQRADMETPTPTTDFVPDTEFLTYVQEAHDELHAMVLDAGGRDLLLRSTSIPAPFTLPADFGSPVSLEKESRDLPPFNFQERHRYADNDYPAWRVIGDASSPYVRLVFYPPTAAPGTLTLWYIPTAPTLAADGNVLVYVGWDRFLVARAAQKAIGKEERTSVAIDRDVGAAVEQIRSQCAELSNGANERIADTHRVDEDLFDAISTVGL